MVRDSLSVPPQADLRYAARIRDSLPIPQSEIRNPHSLFPFPFSLLPVHFFHPRTHSPHNGRPMYRTCPLIHGEQVRKRSALRRTAPGSAVYRKDGPIRVATVRKRLLQCAPQGCVAGALPDGRASDCPSHTLDRHGCRWSRRAGLCQCPSVRALAGKPPMAPRRVLEDHVFHRVLVVARARPLTGRTHHREVEISYLRAFKTPRSPFGVFVTFTPGVATLLASTGEVWEWGSLEDEYGSENVGRDCE